MDTIVTLYVSIQTEFIHDFWVSSSSHLNCNYFPFQGHLFLFETKLSKHNLFIGRENFGFYQNFCSDRSYSGTLGIVISIHMVLYYPRCGTSIPILGRSCIRSNNFDCGGIGFANSLNMQNKSPPFFIFFRKCRRAKFLPPNPKIGFSVNCALDETGLVTVKLEK